MAKRKLLRFKESKQFPHFFQPTYEEVINCWPLRGKWSEDYFGNNHPIILELGCGKGEYVVGLARKYPECNYIGIDIKGARMWRGAKTAQEEGLKNVAFIRTRVENVNYLFGTAEISEVWITFPDPQLLDSRSKKRLTHPAFLNRYRLFLKEDHLLHLKTDSVRLYAFTLGVLKHNGYEILQATSDLYSVDAEGEEKRIRTFYEEMFRKQGLPITYIRFRVDINNPASVAHFSSFALDITKPTFEPTKSV